MRAIIASGAMIFFVFAANFAGAQESYLYEGAAQLVETEAAAVFRAPRLIRFQGRLSDKNGEWLCGKYILKFRIYALATTGSLKWNETHKGADGSGLEIKDGIIDVLLGSTYKKGINLLFNEQYYLEVMIEDPGTGKKETLKPRFMLTSVPYALKAQN